MGIDETGNQASACQIDDPGIRPDPGLYLLITADTGNFIANYSQSLGNIVLLINRYHRSIQESNVCKSTNTTIIHNISSLSCCHFILRNNISNFLTTPFYCFIL